MRAVPILVFALLCAEPAAPQDPPLRIELDPLPAAAISPVRGVFEAAEPGVRLTSAEQYDNAAFFGPVLEGRYWIEVELTHEAGLVGGGLIFACRDADRAPPEFGQMIRFDTPRELLFGHFLRGQFEAAGRIALPHPLEPGARVVLRVEVDAATRTAAVQVDGAVVAGGLPLRFGEGRAALQGSMGQVLFHAVRAVARPPARPVLAWPTALTVRPDGFAVRDHAGRVFRIGTDGRPAELLEAGRDDPAPRTSVRGARIDGGAVALAGGATFTGRAIGGIDAADLARSEDGRLFVLDRLGRRVVEVPRDGDGGLDRLVFAGHRVRLDPPAPAFVTDAAGSLVGVSDGAGFIGPLEPMADYVVRAPVGYRAWPGGGGGAWREVRFQAPPPDGMMRIRRLKVVVAVFGNVAETPDEARTIPPLDDAGYARIEREVRGAALWYFQCSARRLWIDLVFVRRAEPVMAGALAESGEPNGAPPIDLLHTLAQQGGVPFEAVSGFVVAMDFRRRDPTTGAWVRVGRGGGLTLGAHGRGHGLSWWFVPGSAGYDAWLFCHEFHHQLDALFEISGHPEYPFNHFSPSLRNVADFGEHWDGNRWILQTWPDHLWDALRFGDFVLVADADGDRLPDRDARLPFDEERFGSRPDRADTDGDGLADGDEALAGRWLVESGFETQLGPRIDPDPRAVDTDGDGIPDGRDAEPLVAAATLLTVGEWTALRAVQDPLLSVDASIRLTTEDRIEVRTRSADAGTLQVQVLLDREADGWFRGPVNARIHARGAGARVVDVLDASSPTDWPSANEALRRSLDAAVTRSDGAVTVAIAPGRPIEPGDAFAVAIAYRGGLARGGDVPWWSLFEPHRLVRFERAAR